MSDTKLRINPLNNNLRAFVRNILCGILLVTIYIIILRGLMLRNILQFANIIILKEGKKINGE